MVQMFLQSNLGVVSAAVIRLTPNPESHLVCYLIFHSLFIFSFLFPFCLCFHFFVVFVIDLWQMLDVWFKSNDIAGAMDVIASLYTNN